MRSKPPTPQRQQPRPPKPPSTTSSPSQTRRARERRAAEVIEAQRIAKTLCPHVAGAVRSAANRVAARSSCPSSSRSAKKPPLPFGNTSSPLGHRSFHSLSVLSTIGTIGTSRRPRHDRSCGRSGRKRLDSPHRSRARLSGSFTCFSVSAIASAASSWVRTVSSQVRYSAIAQDTRSEAGHRTNLAGRRVPSGLTTCATHPRHDGTLRWVRGDFREGASIGTVEGDLHAGSPCPCRCRSD